MKWWRHQLILQIARKERIYRENLKIRRGANDSGVIYLRRQDGLASMKHVERLVLVRKRVSSTETVVK